MTMFRGDPHGRGNPAFLPEAIMALPSLYTIATQHRALLALDVEEIDEQSMLDTLEALEGDLQTKATSVVAFQRNVQAYADMADAAAEALRNRARVLQNKADSVLAYMKRCMENGNITKIESAEFTARIQNNPPRVVVDDQAQLPAEFVIQKPAPPPEPSKTLIGNALKAGQEVPGAHLEQSTRLVIK
jgi:hypothetical protein